MQKIVTMDMWLFPEDHSVATIKKAELPPLLLRIGDWEVLLYGCTPGTENYVHQFWELFPASLFSAPGSGKECQHLVITSPSVLDEQVHLTWLSESGRHAWTSFHKAWGAAYRQFCRARSLISPREQDPTRHFTFSWPELEFESTPCSDPSLDQERPTQFFCLVIDEPDERGPTAIFVYSLFLATCWHVVRGGLCLHSAAVVRGGDGFLFLGDSLAGKTTLAQLSATVGKKVLADELNFVIRSEESCYTLAAAPTLQPSSVGYAALRPPLRGLFTLVKDNEDYLIPLSPMVMAQALFNGFLQTPVGRKLPGTVTKLAFQAACDIARRVPGYELHFRRSPDFWKLIDEQFPD